MQQQIRIIEIKVHEFATRQRYRKGRDFQTYLTPMTITYQLADESGQFEEVPNLVGFPLNSAAIEPARRKLEDFMDALPTFDCDFADVLLFLLGKVVMDYDETTEGGIVAVAGNPKTERHELSAIGVKYMTFEEAYHTFEIEPFLEFLKRELEKMQVAL